MRILVHEFVSGGGLAGRKIPVSLAREGAAMRTALIADLAAIGQHQIVATADPRFPVEATAGVEVVTLARPGGARLDDLIVSADAVWLVAPETDGCLERLAARAERNGTTVLGSGASAIRRAANKAGLPRRLARHGVPHPRTRVLRPGRDGRTDWDIAAREVGFPMVVKPWRGAGCRGVSVARDTRELRHALEIARRSTRGPLLLQQYVRGLAGSVSLVADGRRAVALTVNTQAVRAARPFSYSGGRTPLDHPLASQAVQAALRTCRALPGLRGFVGVDLVLTESQAIVIEVNPRLTTAYLGVRSAVGGNPGAAGNVAALAIAACAGTLPAAPPILRCVRFTAAGKIVQ